MMKFAKKKSAAKTLKEQKWRVLVVDDEKEVHNITYTVLKKFVYEDMALELISAFSGKEAIEILKKEKDIAVVLLDVVMEEDDSGLKVAKAIRGELQNKAIRIILRTGQPGNAPEKDVILNYDINDYKEKTELTSTKLFTTIISALRSYRDLQIIDANRKGLEKIIEATQSILKVRSLKLFSEGVLIQLNSLLQYGTSSMIVTTNDGFGVSKIDNRYEIIAKAGKYQNQTCDTILTDETIKLLDKAIYDEKSFFEDDKYIGFFKTKNGNSHLIYVIGIDKKCSYSNILLNIFLTNVSIAFDNLMLNEEIINTQREIVETLGEVVESRSKEVANHVNRVAIVSYILAVAVGLDEEEAIKIKMASPMHDIGKIGIADNILLKPGHLSIDEFEQMKAHTTIGRDILGSSDREILKAASIIAYQHHERWDGEGYPQGLKGEEIHIYGRITSIADVFDALSEKRIYKEAWSEEKVLDYFREKRGKQFDPNLVDLFFENLIQIQKSINVLK